MSLVDIWSCENMDKLVESEAFIDCIKIEGASLRNEFLLRFGCFSVYCLAEEKDHKLSCYGWRGSKGGNGVFVKLFSRELVFIG